MKMIQSMHLFVVLTVLLGFAGGVPLPTAAQTVPVMHVLLIIDDAEPFRVSIENRSQMNRVFWEICRLAVDCEVTELKSTAVDDDSPEWLSKVNILKWIGARSDNALKVIADREVPIGKDDIVFVYFSGHGGAHRNTRELYLDLPGNVRFDRKLLAAAIDAIPCRLKILLTDAGSQGVPIILTDTREPTDDIVELQEQIEREWVLDEDLFPVEAFEHLLYEHEGFFDLTAATEGELTFASGTEGGIFTRAFVDTMFLTDKFGYDDGFASWEEVFEVTKLKAHAYFEESVNSLPTDSTARDRFAEVGQQSLRPKYFGELPQRIMRED